MRDVPHTLAMIRNAGIEPNVIEYLNMPPDRQTLQPMIRDAGLTVRQAIGSMPRYGQFAITRA